jgi:glutamate dehydrogenase
MMARAAIRDDIHYTQERLVEQVLEQTTDGQSVEQRIDEWERLGQADINHAAATLTEMVVEGATDLGRLTVAVKALKTLVTVRRARISLSGARVN